VNLAFLAPDIYLAHSTNLFREPAEYVPFYFSLAAPGLLLSAAAGAWRGSERVWRVRGYVVGCGAVVVGVAGLILHLGSRFFSEATLESLVYTAPFAAPLSYTGLGLLLIMNRMVDPESAEWPLWVLLLTLGGFVGNFIFSLAGHAQNAFFHRAEWVPVAASAFAAGFLLSPFVVRLNRSYGTVCAAVMLVQVAVGLLGFYYHTAANLRGPSASRFDNLVYGAPAMAPLWFPNLALPALIGPWRLRDSLSPSRARAPALSPGDTSR
jgi:hypothetical protein